MSVSEMQLGRPVSSFNKHSKEYKDHQIRIRCSFSTSPTSSASERMCSPNVSDCRIAKPQKVQALVPVSTTQGKNSGNGSDEPFLANLPIYMAYSKVVKTLQSHGGNVGQSGISI
jgi:hypothetical protein